MLNLRRLNPARKYRCNDAQFYQDNSFNQLLSCLPCLHCTDLSFHTTFTFNPQDCMCSSTDILDDKKPAPLCKTIQTLIDIKASSKVSHSSTPNGQSSVGSRSTPSRSRTALSSGTRASAGQSNSKTISSSSHGRRSQNAPLHSVV